jgi:putative acetyltransferase
MNIELRTVGPDNWDLHQLIAKLDEELLERYPKQGIFGLDFNDPKVKEVTFVIAYLRETPVGCGAIRPLDSDCAELKRFYVDPGYRNQGIASRILIFLEHTAQAFGYHRIRLETGPKQPEAIRLYEKNGYYPIELFGEYIGCEHSLCFEKMLIP